MQIERAYHHFIEGILFRKLSAMMRIVVTKTALLLLS